MMNYIMRMIRGLYSILKKQKPLQKTPKNFPDPTCCEITTGLFSRMVDCQGTTDPYSKPETPGQDNYSQDAMERSVASVKDILDQISTTNSVEERLKRVKVCRDLLLDIPENTRLDVKNKVLHLLLNVERSTTDVETKAVLREVFAVLGYAGPLPGRGIRILAMDGGGMRGLATIAMLQQLQKLTGVI
jgi:hypothetical protein